MVDATIRRSTVLLSGVEPVATEARDERAAARRDRRWRRRGFSAFATSRWPGLVRLAYGLTGDRWMAEDLAQTALAGTTWPGGGSAGPMTGTLTCAAS